MNHFFHKSSSVTLGRQPSGKFEDLITQLSAAHAQDIQSLQHEYDDKVRFLKDEVASLRSQLGEASISPDDVRFSTAAVQHVEAAFERTSQPEVQDANTFSVKPDWQRNLDDGAWGKKLDAMVIRYKNRGKENSTLMLHDELDVPAPPRGKRLIIPPTSNYRLVWDICGLCFIAFDLLIIPFSTAFQPAPAPFFEVMDMSALLFWTGDMLQGFFLGYYDKGHYVDDHRRITFHYLRTWFLVDIVVVGPEWIILLAGSFINSEGDSVNSLAKLVKGARAIRVLRLLRLLKLQRIMNLMYDMIESEWTFIVLNLSRLLICVVVLNHVIACVWYLIGRWRMESYERSWISVGNVNGTSMTYRYTTSLHWSLTQFTPASMDISARNTWERVFSIIVLFFALVTFSSIIASITGSTTSLRNMRTDEMKQFWLLRRYLRQRKVSNDLSNRIFKFLEHQLKAQSQLVQRGSIRILAGLSEALQNEMTHQMNSPHLMGHPLFVHIETNMKAVMQRLCHNALKNQTYAEKETVFNWGDMATKMYFIKAGYLIYTKVDGAELAPPPGPQDWISEPVLWTTWRHQGDFISDDTSELISVEPKRFIDVMAVHPRPWYFSKHYAALFIANLNSTPRASLSDVMRDPDFYESAVRESESIFYNEEKRRSLLAASCKSTTCSEQNGEVKSEAPEDEALKVFSSEEEPTEEEVQKPRQRGKQERQQRLLGLFPCSAGVPRCLP
mmetsp:Transcript_130623/g.406147  ORF Transcript_130623/g.406147 Transcript_130623/m.406147 type:complete len:727 (-) Transcript_130623:51-2231(-)